MPDAWGGRPLDAERLVADGSEGRAATAQGRRATERELIGRGRSLANPKLVCRCGVFPGLKPSCRDAVGLGGRLQVSLVLRVSR